MHDSNFNATPIYHMVGKMMQGTIQMPANVTMREMKEYSLADSEEGTMKDAAKASIDALRYPSCNKLFRNSTSLRNS